MSVFRAEILLACATLLAGCAAPAPPSAPIASSSEANPSSLLAPLQETCMMTPKGREGSGTLVIGSQATVFIFNADGSLKASNPDLRLPPASNVPTHSKGAIWITDKTKPNDSYMVLLRAQNGGTERNTSVCFNRGIAQTPGAAIQTRGSTFIIEIEILPDLPPGRYYSDQSDQMAAQLPERRPKA